jgi:hypothetical protein
MCWRLTSLTGLPIIVQAPPSFDDVAKAVGKLSREIEDTGKLRGEIEEKLRTPN